MYLLPILHAVTDVNIDRAIGNGLRCELLQDDVWKAVIIKTMTHWEHIMYEILTLKPNTLV